MIRISRCIFLSMLLLWAIPAFAVTNLVLSSSDGSAYVLSGQNVDGAAAFECSITYDAALLDTPKVQLGTLAAGALMAVNTNTPGTIRIAFIRTAPMNGNGPIATIAFIRKGESNGRVNVLSAKMVTLDGRPLPLLVQVLNPPEPSAPSTTAAPDKEHAQQQGTAADAGLVSQPQPIVLPLVGGGLSVPMSGEERSRTEEPGVQRDEGAAVPERPVAVNDPVRQAKRSEGAMPPSPSRKIYSHKSVLERFRDFRGTPTMAAYLALFEQEGMIGFRQDPPIALSDGKSTVRVSFISSSPTRTSSDIALMGAKLLSFKSDPDYTNTFVLELQPAKGGIQASVSVPQDAVLMVFPLTVAFKVDIDVLKNGKVDDSTFKRFLAERGTGEKPTYDLNGDGRRDHLDDYLFTANYLAQQEKGRLSKNKQ